MINFLEAVKHQLQHFVENGQSKPVHLKQNQLINDIYRAMANDSQVLLYSGQQTYKGYISRYDKDRQCLFIEQENVINMLALKDIKRLKVLEKKAVG